MFSYYLHHTDAVTGNAHFRVELERGMAIYKALSARVVELPVPDMLLIHQMGRAIRRGRPIFRGEIMATRRAT